MINKLTELITMNGFTLSTEISTDTFGRFSGTLSKNNGSRFFFKAVSKLNNYGYSSLLSESHVTKTLHEVTKSNEITGNGFRLLVPKVEETIMTDDFVLLITEHIEGNKLIEQAPEDKIKILDATINHVMKLGAAVRPGSLSSHLKNYSVFSLLKVTPIRALKACYLSPRLWSGIAKALLNIPAVVKLNQESTLVHADLNISNIIYRGNEIYLVDWEQAGWGIPEYNIAAPLSVHWGDTKIRNSIIQKLGNRKEKIAPLLAYIVLVLLSQKIDPFDPRRIRDLELLKFVSAGKELE